MLFSKRKDGTTFFFRGGGMNIRYYSIFELMLNVTRTKGKWCVMKNECDRVVGMGRGCGRSVKAVKREYRSRALLPRWEMGDRAKRKIHTVNPVFTGYV